MVDVDILGKKFLLQGKLFYFYNKYGRMRRLTHKCTKHLNKNVKTFNTSVETRDIHYIHFVALFDKMYTEHFMCPNICKLNIICKLRQDKCISFLYRKFNIHYCIQPNLLLSHRYF